MRRMGFLFLCLTFLAGVTIGTVVIALINVVLFLGLALLVARYIGPRYGSNGLAFGMAGAFFISFMWPVVAQGLRAPEDCLGDDCPANQPGVIISMEPLP